MSLYSESLCDSQYSVCDFNISSGIIEGVSFDDGLVKISDCLYSNLKLGEVQDILVTYTLKGPYGSEIPQTSLFRLLGTKEGAIVSNPFGLKQIMKEGSMHFDLNP